MCRQVLAVISRQHLAGGWQELEWGVRGGGRMFEHCYRAPFFQHLTDVPGLEATYSRGMAALDHSCEGSSLPAHMPRHTILCRSLHAGPHHGSAAHSILLTVQQEKHLMLCSRGGRTGCPADECSSAFVEQAEGCMHVSWVG